MNIVRGSARPVLGYGRSQFDCNIDCNMRRLKPFHWNHFNEIFLNHSLRESQLETPEHLKSSRVPVGILNSLPNSSKGQNFWARSTKPFEPAASEFSESLREIRLLREIRIWIKLFDLTVSNLKRFEVLKRCFRMNATFGLHCPSSDCRL